MASKPRRDPVEVPAGCPLSPRQLQVLLLIADGHQEGYIAYEMGIRPTTVRTFRYQIRRKLGVGSTTAAVVVAFNAGWLDPTQSECCGDVLRFEDRRVTEAQRAYLREFDFACRVSDSETEQAEEAKLLTDAAARRMGVPVRSTSGRDWMDRLISNMARMP